MPRMSSIIPLLCAVPLLMSCGGTTGTTGGAPSPTPTATATPSPSPSPTPTPTPSPASLIAMVGGAQVGQSLYGSAVCDGTVQRGANGFVSGVTGIGAPYGYADALQIYFSAVDRLEIDTARFPYGILTLTSTDGFVARYGAPETDLQLPRSSALLSFATLGQAVLYDELCYFALAPDALAQPPAGGQTQYIGLVDGFLREPGGTQYRLFASEAGLDFISGSNYRLTLRLRGRAQPFSDITGQDAVSLGSVTATVAYNPATGTFTLVSPPAGASQAYLSGRLEGQLFLGAVFTFHFVDAGGRVFFGAAAMDGAQI